jgi:hypothetical protein
MKVRGFLRLTYIKPFASSNCEKCTHIGQRGRLPERGLPVPAP